MKNAILILAALAILGCEEEQEDPVIEYELTVMYEMHCDEAMKAGLIPEGYCLNGSTFVSVARTYIGDPSGSQCIVSSVSMPCHGCDPEAENIIKSCEEWPE